MSGSELERAGLLEPAIEAYRKEGRAVDAARVMISLGRVEDAGLLLAQHIRKGRATQWSEEARQHALTAAICLAASRRAMEAAEIFLELRDPLRAIEVLEANGRKLDAERVRAQYGIAKKAVARITPQQRPAEVAKTAPPKPNASARPPTDPPPSKPNASARPPTDPPPSKPNVSARPQTTEERARVLAMREAARTAEAAEDFPRAAELYEHLGQYAHAARCRAEAGRPDLALAALYHISPSDPDYRACANLAVELACREDAVDFRLDHFLRPWLASGPADAEEAKRFTKLAELQKRHGHTIAPEQAETAEQRGPDPLPELPDLPPLPPLPSLPPPPSAKTAKAPARPSIDVTDLPPGYALTERYQIGKRLGRGGSAVVYAARDLEIHTDVAVKIFVRDGQSDPDEQLDRFKREVQLARQLDHPNVVRTFDIDSAGNHWFITMELLTGHSLRELMNAGPLGLDRSLALLEQAADALQHAHDRGIVHRDIKPHNLFVLEGDRLKVMDFGIAKSLHDSGHTRTSAMAGTPHYMAPEQISGFKRVAPPADIYSLGIIAFEMLTGRVPFSHDDVVPILMMQLSETPPPLRSINPELPEALERAILCALEKDPARRFPSCKAFKAELQRTR